MTFPEHCRICGKESVTFDGICYDCITELSEDD